MLYEAKPPVGFWQKLSSYIIETRPSVFQYIAHFEKFDNLEIISFHYSPMTDELLVVIKQSVHCFILEMAWGGDIELTAKNSVPEELFNELVAHMKLFERVSINDENNAKKRYASIAKNKSENW